MMAWINTLKNSDNLFRGSTFSHDYNIWTSDVTFDFVYYLLLLFINICIITIIIILYVTGHWYHLWVRKHGKYS